MLDARICDLFIFSFFVAKICFVVTSFIRKTQCGKMCILKQKILESKSQEEDNWKKLWLKHRRERRIYIYTHTHTNFIFIMLQSKHSSLVSLMNSAFHFIILEQNLTAKLCNVKCVGKISHCIFLQISQIFIHFVFHLACNLVDSSCIIRVEKFNLSTQLIDFEQI